MLSESESKSSRVLYAVCICLQCVMRGVCERELCELVLSACVGWSSTLTLQGSTWAKQAGENERRKGRERMCEREKDEREGKRWKGKEKE